MATPISFQMNVQLLNPTAHTQRIKFVFQEQFLLHITYSTIVNFTVILDTQQLHQVTFCVATSHIQYVHLAQRIITVQWKETVFHLKTVMMKLKLLF